ncbi:hypothetical protein QAD02_019432 [Eretmocerus hayati]|uniref:Uncharacterized protein n=1 Tax=Eretmocerus hayati TaxID=131215 RepID=A0ACC2PPD3_9HYME|nr:hypothetical protein QAD02_019432 [Eretmocerus hayati]
MTLSPREQKEKTKDKDGFGRNYLYSCVSSYLPSSYTRIEKIISERKIRIFICTWNMNGQKPPSHLGYLLAPKISQNIVDLIVIGTQETYTCKGNKWVTFLQNIIGSSYILSGKKRLGKLKLVLFLRRELVWFSSRPKADTVLSNKYTIFKTKGAISLAIIIFGTSFLFITTHLAPHQDNSEKRVDQIERIIRSLDDPKKLLSRDRKDIVKNFDCVFLFGDLNFRINRPREEVISWISKTHFPTENSRILESDQLKEVLMSDTPTFKCFEEAPIAFPPTYKYARGGQVLDSSSKHRVPSYTDRILYRSKNTNLKTKERDDVTYSQNGVIQSLKYDSAREICSSDHKPVYGIYAVTVRSNLKVTQEPLVEASDRSKSRRWF